MAKGPDWNDVHRANPGDVRDALTEPDVPFDDAPLAQPNGNGHDYFTEEELPGHSQAPVKFPFIAFKDVTFDLDEECRVEGIFPLVGLACIFGGPSTVKSFIVQDLNVRMVRGGLWGGREVKQCPVIYIAAEGAGGIKKRIAGLKKVAGEKGLPVDIPFQLITVAPNLGAGNGDCKKLIADIDAQLPEGVQPGAITVDTTQQSLGGADENGAGMDQLVVNCTAIFNHFQCLVILIHHTPVSDDERLRGKGSLGAGLDVSIIIKREKGSMVAALIVKKMRDEDDEQAFTVHLVRVVLGKTKKGREVSTLVVDSVEPGASEPAKQDRRKAAEILRDEFIAAYDRLADGAPKSLGLDDRSSVLKVSVKAVQNELKKRGLLEIDEEGKVTPTARSHFHRAKAELVKTKGGKLVEENGFLWRP
jgi:AAA domain